MNDLPRQKLCELIAKYGSSLCDEPLRCEGLLRDFCGEYKGEIHVLVSALKERVAVDLLGSDGRVPQEALFARLNKRLRENLGLAEDAAQWAVESWALALGVISSVQREPSKKNKAAQRKSSTESKRESGKKDKSIAERRRVEAAEQFVKAAGAGEEHSAVRVFDTRASSVQRANAEKKQEIREVESGGSLNAPVSSSKAGKAWAILAVVLTAIVLWALYVNQSGQPQRQPSSASAPAPQTPETVAPSDGRYTPPAPVLGPNAFRNIPDPPPSGSSSAPQTSAEPTDGR
jgi:hypothetical protein